MSKDTNTHPTGPAPSAQHTSRVGDGFLNTLADLETRLSALKTLHEQSESAQQALAGREQILTARETEVASRLETLEKRQAEVERQAEEARQFRREAEEFKRTAESGLAESRAGVENREREAERRLREVTESEKATERSRQEAEAQRAEAEKLRAEAALQNAQAEKLRNEVEARRAEVEKLASQREQALQQRERDLASRQVKAESAAAEARQTQQAVEEERRGLEERDAQIAKRLQQVSERELAILAEQDRVADLRRAADEENQTRERAVRELEQELHEREIDLQKHADELERERASVAEHARTLAAQMKAGEEEANAALWANRMESIQLQLGEASAQRARTETELAQAKQDIESLTQELLDATQNRGMSAEEVAKRDQKIESTTRDLEETRATLQMLQTQMEQSGRGSQEHEVEIARLTTELKNATSKGEHDVRALRAELEKAESAAKQAAERAEQVERDAKAATELLAESERKAPEALERASKAEQEARELERSLTTLRAEMEKTVADAASRVSVENVRERDREIERLRESLNQAMSKSGDAGAALAQTLAARDREIAELRQQLTESRSGATADPAAMEERDRTIAQLRDELEHARGATPTDASANEELLKREQAIVLLKERLEQVMAERSELAERVERQDAGEELATQDGGEPTEADLRRRDRLRKYKSLLQGQARKILAAQNALQRRHAECETVLNHRAKLAAMAQELARVEKKVTGSKARAGTGAALLYMVATLSIIAVMSWEVSKRVWPGTYIAKAVLESDTGRRTPSAEDLAAWQSDHESLIKDPRLLEVVAERMGRRGIASMSTPVDLKSRIDRDMYVQSARPGQITVELRGEGAERTALVLDTFVTAMKSVADQMRDERSNDIGVTIAQAAASGAEPLLDKRIEKAASVFGGAALAVGLAGLVIWSRLVRAKKKFDHAQAVEAALHEVDWKELETTLKKSGSERKSSDMNA